MPRLTPAIGAKGAFEVRAPYSLLANTQYKCLAVRSFVDCYRRSEQVEQLYYGVVGLIDGQNGFSFQDEVNAGACIITLEAASGQVIYIPDTYITRLPTTEPVTYNQVLVSVNLGILPSDVNLQTFIDELRDKAIEITGVQTNTVNVHVYPLIEPIDETAQVLYEQTRLGMISQSKSSAAQLVLVQEQLNASQESNRQLTLLLS